jgi:hypothetical protein
MFDALVAAVTVESQRAVAVLAGVLIAGGAVCQFERIKAAARRAKRPFRGVHAIFGRLLRRDCRKFSGSDARWRLKPTNDWGACSDFVHRIA